MRNNIQSRMLSLLAIEKKKGNNILSLSYISEKFGLSTKQISLSKNELKLKGLIDDPGSGLISIKGYYAVEPVKIKFNKVCHHLTKKDKRGFYCPVKNVFIDERHYRDMCGCAQYTDNKKVHFLPFCYGWIRVAGKYL